MANNGGGKVFRANKTSLAFVDQFTSQEERLEDMECDPVTFSGIGKEVMWVRHTPQSVEADDLITAFEIEAGTCGLGGNEPKCGDGNVDAGEQCDDGNNANGDGCSATCQTEVPQPICGNSVIEAGEACDDGNTANGDGCSSTCQIEIPVCGNGFLESGEQCDDQ
jgi:cysteine-rich repeat protein